MQQMQQNGPAACRGSQYTIVLVSSDKPPAPPQKSKLY